MDSASAPALILLWFQLLGAVFGPAAPMTRRSPIGQLVKSLISSRTRDAVSAAAYDRLTARFASPADMAAADVRAVERTIADVTFADVKAARLIAALRAVQAERADFRLHFLGRVPLPEALAWLERLPGVGRKTAASTLNFSTLRRPVFVADTHVTRVLRRLGLIGLGGSAGEASAVVTAAMPDWPADAFITFHAHLKRLGQLVCRWDVPLCTACPLARHCAWARATAGPATNDPGASWRPKLPARMG